MIWAFLHRFSTGFCFVPQIMVEIMKPLIILTSDSIWFMNYCNIRPHSLWKKPLPALSLKMAFSISIFSVFCVLFCWYKSLSLPSQKSFLLVNHFPSTTYISLCIEISVWGLSICDLQDYLILAFFFGFQKPALVSNYMPASYD